MILISLRNGLPNQMFSRLEKIHARFGGGEADVDAKVLEETVSSSGPNASAAGSLDRISTQLAVKNTHPSTINSSAQPATK